MERKVSEKFLENSDFIYLGYEFEKNYCVV